MMKNGIMQVLLIRSCLVYGFLGRKSSGNIFFPSFICFELAIFLQFFFRKDGMNKGI